LKKRGDKNTNRTDYGRKTLKAELGSFLVFFFFGLEHVEQQQPITKHFIAWSLCRITLIIP
jgi:hypothetical protein